jgi:hypothetical protein
MAFFFHDHAAPEKNRDPHRRCAVAGEEPRSLDPARPAGRRAPVLRQKEITMIALYDHIQQLQCEFANSISHRERAEIAAELKKAIADQAILDRKFDQAFETLIEEAR